MFPKFLEAAGESLGKGAGENFVNRLFGPATLFWGTGILVYIWTQGWPDLSKLDTVTQLTWLAIGLVVIVMSDVVIEWFTLPLLRLLEGYDWPEFLRQRKITRLQTKLKDKNSDWQNLGKKLRKLGKLKGKDPAALSTEEKTWLENAQRNHSDWLKGRVQIDVLLNDYPVNMKHLMPTRIGNLLRAAEDYPYERYGLEAITVWPRLWFALPESAQQELKTARLQLDRAVRLMSWGILLPLWMPIVIWLESLSLTLSPNARATLAAYLLPLLLGLLMIVIGYQGRAIPAARLYANLIRTVFDLYRFDLYKQMSWPLPEKNNEEKEQGEQLTLYITRGYTDPDIAFERRKE